MKVIGDSETKRKQDIDKFDRASKFVILKIRIGRYINYGEKFYVKN
jgi:hypothetical protein